MMRAMASSNTTMPTRIAITIKIKRLPVGKMRSPNPCGLGS
jgi:hypothetical protein